nr:HIRAN domain-containing protein [Baileyella intestinalis]
MICWWNLVNEVHLFDTYVAGTTHLEDKTVLDQIHLDDKLSLVREENEFDEKAIVIKTADGRKLGYVPEKDNLVFSRLMDAGKLLTARINTHELRGTFHRIGIGIYLVDYGYKFYRNFDDL